MSNPKYERLEKHRMRKKQRLVAKRRRDEAAGRVEDAVPAAPSRRIRLDKSSVLNTMAYFAMAVGLILAGHEIGNGNIAEIQNGGASLPEALAENQGSPKRTPTVQPSSLGHTEITIKSLAEANSTELELMPIGEPGVDKLQELRSSLVSGIAQAFFAVTGIQDKLEENNADDNRPQKPIKGPVQAFEGEDLFLPPRRFTPHECGIWQRADDSFLRAPNVEDPDVLV